MDIHVPLASTTPQNTDPDETLWARIVSFVISPPIVWAVWVYPIALSVTASTKQALIHASIFTSLVCLMPMIFVAYMVKVGKIGDLHMRESQERYIPYSLSIIGAMVTGVSLWQLGAHAVLLILTMITFVQLSFMLLGTFFIHISAHAMAISSVTSATAIIFSFTLSLIFVPIILLVILARLVMQRHTPAQIVAGTLVGVLTPYLVIFMLNQML